MAVVGGQLIADAVARLFAATNDPTPKRGVRFPEIAARTTTASIPTRHGDVEATVYHPGPEPGRKSAVYVNAHGGGFAAGHREQDDPWCRYLAARAGVTVINIDYVLAPRFRFPAPVEQMYDVLRWASAPHHDWDGTRLCVGGQSAGGSLAAAACRLALENAEPRIVLQVLHYPPLDLVTATKNKHSPLGSSAVLNPRMSDVFDAAYIPDPHRRRDRLASPAWGTNGNNLHGIAPAVIVAAEFDRLRSEAAAYADKLNAAGALREYHEVAGLDHGYNLLSDTPDAVAATRKTYDLIAGHVIAATA